jgi:acyl carrier protein
MMKVALKNDLSLIFQRVFENLTIEISEVTTANDIENWDSLTNMLLILEIEKHFKIKFSFKEVRTFKNVGDLMASIEQHVQ